MRDGIGEGFFDLVLTYEVHAMRTAALKVQVSTTIRSGLIRHGFLVLSFSFFLFLVFLYFCLSFSILLRMYAACYRGVLVRACM